MRDQLNGQLYDVVMTDCDAESRRAYDMQLTDSDVLGFLGLMGFVEKRECGFGECRGACDVCHDDDYSHNIVPARKDAAYEGYYDCNKISTVAENGESLQQGSSEE